MAKEIKTFVYKTVDDLDIKVDVHVPHSSGSAAPFPVLFWIHGGGCVQGCRHPDYRLAPQVRLPTILTDVGDAFLWAMQKLPQLLPGTLDTTRTVVSGSSVGGYLAAWLGLGKIPSVPLGAPELRQIKGLALVYPITTFNSTFWSEPREPYGGYLPREITEDSRWVTFLDPTAPAVSNTDAGEWETLSPAYKQGRGKGCDPLRSRFYPYAQQFAPEHGLDRLNFSPQQIADGLLEEYDVPRWLAAEHARIAASGPATRMFIVHGEADKAVDVAQGRALAKLASSLGWSVEYEERPGLDHMFDEEPDAPENVMDAYWAFVTKALAP